MQASPPLEPALSLSGIQQQQDDTTLISPEACCGGVVGNRWHPRPI